VRRTVGRGLVSHLFDLQNQKTVSKRKYGSWN